MAQKPSLTALGGGRQQFLDLAGDGQVDLVELQGPTPGFYERTGDERWEAFVPFTSVPKLEWDNPNLKFVDLTGDGHADIAVYRPSTGIWYLLQSTNGFTAVQWGLSQDIPIPNAYVPYWDLGFGIWDLGFGI